MLALRLFFNLLRFKMNDLVNFFLKCLNLYELSSIRAVFEEVGILVMFSLKFIRLTLEVSSLDRAVSR